MFKELILAIALGALLGFGITGGYLAVKKNNSPKTTNNISVTPTASISGAIENTPSPTKSINSDPSKNSLTIDSPENESVVSNSQITIKGTSSPLSSIIITTSVKNYFTTTDKNGNFSLNIEIGSGINQIQVDSIDSQDNQTTTQILVTYSTAKF